jgi:hypothetical protein
MVTKRQQLKWLAKRFESLPFDSDSILMSDEVLGHMGYEHKITNQEIKRERDKMQKKAEQVAQPAPDNSWHERGEFPPVGTICEMIDDKNTWLECEVISHKDGSCIGWIPSRKSPFYTYYKSEFSPLRTEREKAIDEMILAIDHIKEGNFETFIGALYDAGYRRVASK